MVTMSEMMRAADRGSRSGCLPPLPPVEERRRLREAAGLSQEQLAVAVGCALRSLFRWERGEREPAGVHKARYVAVLALIERRTRNVVRGSEVSAA
jgi:DNA-binding transcriptional regulator YiaG